MAINTRELLLLCQEMALLHERLHRAGLHKTAQHMKFAVDEVGYEVEGKIERAKTNV